MSSGQWTEVKPCGCKVTHESTFTSACAEHRIPTALNLAHKADCPHDAAWKARVREGIRRLVSRLVNAGYSRVSSDDAETLAEIERLLDERSEG